MTRPSFQFYPGDWLKDTKLRRCSHAARGAWIDVLCVLHDSEEYGVARFPMAELANAAGAPIKLLKELADKGVLKGCDKGECAPLIYTPRSGRKAGPAVTLVPPTVGPIWYSSRMVKDEYVRTVRGEGSRFGEGSGGASKPSPKGGIGEGQSDGSSSSTSSSIGKVVESDRAHARAGAVDNSDPPEANGIPPTPAGQVFRAALDVGLEGATPNDSRLHALLGQGAGVAEIVAVVNEAADKGKSWPWALTVVERRRGDAARIDLAPAPPPDPNAWTATRSGIEAKGAELGLGRWDQDAFDHGQGETFAAYTERVRRAANQ
ncbi:hypothetical protein [Azohydromonas lata]|uniref:hypothetical protein n=1 Tax=Azohydromonas lata TaxID=45677 RepID=UPI0012F4AECB|nr:hypothetical protein [Azohydromonas lata]